MIEFDDGFDGRLNDYINKITCRNCTPLTKCNRHAGRNVREINRWLKGKKAKRNPYFQRDDWETQTSIQAKFSEN